MKLPAQILSEYTAAEAVLEFAKATALTELSTIIKDSRKRSGLRLGEASRLLGYNNTSSLYIAERYGKGPRQVLRVEYAAALANAMLSLEARTPKPKERMTAIKESVGRYRRKIRAFPVGDAPITQPVQ